MPFAIKPRIYQKRKFNISAVRSNSAYKFDPVSASIPRLAYAEPLLTRQLDQFIVLEHCRDDRKLGIVN